MVVKRSIRDIEIVTRGQFVDSYQRSFVGEHAAQILDNYHIFPLTYENQQLQYLNVLGLNVYFSGSLSKEGQRGFRAAINGGRAHQRDLSDVVEQNLGLTFSKTNNRGDVVRKFGKNGGPYARLLSLMGFHTGGDRGKENYTKAKIGSELPQYLTQIVDSFNELTAKDKLACKKYLRDLVLTLFDTRTTVHHERIMVIDFLCQPSKELLEKQIHQVVRAFNIVYPESKVSGDNVRFDKKTQSAYGAQLRLPLDTAAQLQQSYGRHSPAFNVEVKLMPNQYSFDRSLFQKN